MFTFCRCVTLFKHAFQHVWRGSTHTRTPLTCLRSHIHIIYACAGFKTKGAFDLIWFTQFCESNLNTCFFFHIFRVCDVYVWWLAQNSRFVILLFFVQNCLSLKHIIKKIINFYLFLILHLISISNKRVVLLHMLIIEYYPQ